MPEAFSRLKFLLDERGLSRAELARQIAAQEQAFNVKSLYRLADPDRPLKLIDLRIVGAICRVLGVGLDGLIVFAESSELVLRTLSEAQQSRLDELMDKHNDGRASPAELDELRDLIDQAEAISRENTRRLVAHRRRLRGHSATDHHAAAS